MGYFVTMIRDKRVAFLAGPFKDHKAALERVDECRRLASEVDPWSDFDLFGTAKSARDRPGVLNKLLSDFAPGDKTKAA